MGPGVTTSSVAYRYDAVGRLASLGHGLAGGGGYQTLGYANPASQVITRTSADDSYASTAYITAGKTPLPEDLHRNGGVSV